MVSIICTTARFLVSRGTAAPVPRSGSRFAPRILGYAGFVHDGPRVHTVPRETRRPVGLLLAHLPPRSWPLIHGPRALVSSSWCLRLEVCTSRSSCTSLAIVMLSAVFEPRVLDVGSLPSEWHVSTWIACVSWRCFTWNGDYRMGRVELECPFRDSCFTWNKCTRFEGVEIQNPRTDSRFTWNDSRMEAVVGPERRSTREEEPTGIGSRTGSTHPEPRGYAGAAG